MDDSLEIPIGNGDINYEKKLEDNNDSYVTEFTSILRETRYNLRKNGLIHKPSLSPNPNPDERTEIIKPNTTHLNKYASHYQHYLSDKFIYNFGHRYRGKAIIINNRDFHPCTELNARHGTDRDAKAIQSIMFDLGFDTMVYDNLTVRDIMRVMSIVSHEDFSHSDCFVMVFLSHGEDDGNIWGTDATFKMEELTSLFRGDVCPTLAGKPKLFFIQACRGTKLDDGIEATDDTGLDDVDSRVIKRIPVEADFLIAYSSVPGYYSWRNCSQGSWFIQSLCRALCEFAHELDLLRILTRVNAYVCTFESNTDDPAMHAKKQCCSIVSMLTKDLYFNVNLLNKIPSNGNVE